MTDTLPVSDVAALVLVHRLRGECPGSVCQETLVWSDGYFRATPYDQVDATEGRITPSTVAAVIDAAAQGQLKEEPLAEAGCDPGVDDVPDQFLVRVATEMNARELVWCRHADADLPPAWDALEALLDEIATASAQPAADIVLRYSIMGGCGMTGSCTTTSIDKTGRRWALAPVPFDEGQVALVSSHADPNEADLLAAMVSETDFAALRASLGEGVCNGCVDGIDFAFDFVDVGEGLDSISNDLALSNHPLLELMWAVAE